MAENSYNKFMNMSRTGAFTRGFGQGLFAEFGDELLAGLKSGFLLNPFNKVFRDRYIDERNKIRESLKSYEEKFPNTTMTGKIAGGTTTAVGTAMIPQTRILKAGSNILQKGLNLAGGGALVGSATKIGAQEGDKGYNPETLQSGFEGGYTGALSSLAGGAIFKGLGVLGAPVIEGIKRRFGNKMSLEAEKVLSTMVEKAQQADPNENIDTIIARIANGEMPAEGNETLGLYLRQLVNEDSGLRMRVNRVLRERATNRSDKSIDDLKTTLAPNTDKNIIKQKKTELQKMREEEDLLYTPIFENVKFASNDIADFIKNEIIPRGLGKKAFDDIVLENPKIKPFFNISKEGEVSYTNRLPTLEESEYILRSLQDQADEVFNSGRNRRGQVIKNLKKDLQNLLDEFSPELKIARSTASQNYASKEALDFGSRALNKSSDEVEDFYETLLEDGNKEAIRMFKMGIVNGLNRTLDTRKKSTLISQINDPNHKIHKILRNIIADDEYGESLLKSLKLADKSNLLAKDINPRVGSQTAILTQGGNKIKSGLKQGADAVGAVISGNPIEMARTFSQTLKGKTNLSDTELSQIADFLTQRDPDLAQKMLSLSADPDLLARALESISDKIAQVGGLASATQMTR